MRTRYSTRWIFYLAMAGLFGVSLAATARAQQADATETVRIDADLVDLKVSVLGNLTETQAPMLEQKDFRVLEDGRPQDIVFFAASDAPFDLVLLLDLSGSTSNKLKMIKRSAKRFIDAARPVDRIAIVTFTDRTALVSNFSLNRDELKAQIDNIHHAVGGTNFWDALHYVIRDLLPRNQSLSRSAIVVMSDGVDNALPDVAGPGSAITFEALTDELQNSEVIVFPIYLDTENEDVNHFHIPRAAYETARQQLTQIASTCGTNLYRAAKLKDLNRLYPQVINDLSRVYSIGYRPSNRSPDGKWRAVEVQIVERPSLYARTRKGYYSRQLALQ